MFLPSAGIGETGFTLHVLTTDDGRVAINLGNIMTRLSMPPKTATELAFSVFLELSKRILIFEAEYPVGVTVEVQEKNVNLVFNPPASEILMEAKQANGFVYLLREAVRKLS